MRGSRTSSPARSRGPRNTCRVWWQGWNARYGWTVAEYAGRLCQTACRGCCAERTGIVDGVRDDVRGYVVEHLVDPWGVLIGDETGFKAVSVLIQTG